MNEKDLDINIKQELKKYSNVKMSSEVSKRIDSTLNDLPDKNINNTKVFNKTIKKTVIAVSLVISILIGGIIISPAIAQTLEKLPLVGSAFKIVGDVGLRLISEEDSSTNINRAQVYKDKKLTITNIVYYESRISIGYLLENRDEASYINQEMRIKGKEIERSFMSYKGEFIDENTYVGILDVELDEKLPDSFKLDILIQELSQEGEIGKSDEVLAEWKFKDLQVKEQESKIFKPNVTKKREDKSLSVEKVILSNISTDIIIDEKGPLQLDKGGFISTEGYILSGMGRYYQVEDDKGRNLEILSMRADEDIVGKYIARKNKFMIEPIDKDTKYLILRRYNILGYKQEMIYESIKKQTTEQLPIVMDQGVNSKITINKIEYVEGKILIYYSYDGILPNDFSYLTVENEKGGLIKEVYRKRVDDERGYNFILAVKPSDKDKKLYLSAKKIPKLEKYLELKIPVK